MMVLCKLFYDSFYVAAGTSSYCVYYYIFYLSKVHSPTPLNTILHSSYRSSEAANKKKLHNGILSTFFLVVVVYCCYSHECGIIAFYIYVELLYAYIYIVVDIYHTFYDFQCLCWYNFGTSLTETKREDKMSEMENVWAILFYFHLSSFLCKKNIQFLY